MTRSRNPFEAVLFGLLAGALFLVALVIILPLLLLAAAFALGTAAYLSLRRVFAKLGQAGQAVGPVRTDGRSNVRVIDGTER